MKSKFNVVALLIVLLATSITGCTSHSQKYIEEAKTVLDANSIDGEVRMVFDRKYDGYGVYDLVVTSDKYSELIDSEKKQLLAELDAIHFEGEKPLFMPKVISQGYTYSLDFEGNLERDGEIYPPLPTSKPFVIPSGDFEMSWDIYNREYNALGGILTIQRQGSKYTQKLVMSDGSIETSDLTIISNGDEIRLTDRPGNSFGDFMFISNTGYLYFCDNQGIIYTVPPINK